MLELFPVNANFKFPKQNVGSGKFRQTELFCVRFLGHLNVVDALLIFFKIKYFN